MALPTCDRLPVKVSSHSNLTSRVRAMLGSYSSHNWSCRNTVFVGHFTPCHDCKDVSKWLARIQRAPPECNSYTTQDSLLPDSSAEVFHTDMGAPVIASARMILALPCHGRRIPLLNVALEDICVSASEAGVVRRQAMKVHRRLHCCSLLYKPNKHILLIEPQCPVQTYGQLPR